MLIIKKRTQGKKKADIKAKELYKCYLSNIKPIESLAGGNTTGSYKISQTEYSSILRDINKEITKTIVLENFELKLPYQLGYLMMKQKPLKYELDESGELITKSLSIDYKAVRDLWSVDEEAREARLKIYHTNENTNGNRMTFIWDKRGSKCFGIRPYYFTACRDVKRMVAKYLKSEDLNLCFFERHDIKDKNLLIYNNKNKV